MRRAARLVGALLVAGLLAGAVAAWQFQSFLQQPLIVPEDGIALDIPPGTSFAAISRELSELGVLSRPTWFRWYGRLTGKAQEVRAGEYRLEAGLTPRSLLDKLLRGDVELYSLTIVEGWTFRELLSALGDHPAVGTAPSFEDWPAVLAAIEANYDFPEGLFLPETYRFPKNTPGVDVLRQAYALMQTTLGEEWQNRAADLPFTTPYEALVLASIIEKETALASERPRIAGVFVRRLQRNMRLQTDPTVIYGIGEAFDGNLTRVHLRTDTPYNTYTRKGLPPTPIALPGQDAIHAALHPADGNEIFFVATGLGDGSHRFSATKEEHDAAVQEYLRRLRNPEPKNND